MSEHGFLLAMLVFVAMQTGISLIVLAVMLYRSARLERIEGISAATFLEVRKVLAQAR